MKVAITGASGFAGRHIAKHLVAQGHKVVSCGRTDPKIEGVPHLSEGRVNKANVIVHCAADTHEWNPSKEAYDQQVETNLNLTKNALLINSDARFIMVSSDSVYSDKTRNFHCEEELVENTNGTLNAYSASSILTEHLVSSHRTRGDYYILRPHLLYGPGSKNLLAKWEKQAEGVFLMPGNNPLMSLTHVNNLARSVEAFVNDYEGNAYGIYNVADSAPVRLHDFVREILTARGKNPQLHRLPYGMSRSASEFLERQAIRKASEDAPMLTPYSVRQLGLESVLNVSKLKQVLGEGLTPPSAADAGSW